ncbi:MULTISPECIES: xanthine dehydrogenase family protein molybdopterin-binding subunit [Streptomyces]|uniref:Xanthine dehydrogenase family protein molybdopterin-binding subunit n=1 Tax=Streptomyces evansiae TaxID=3075535 RepID=A0ABU2RAF5_9ACTN|nr:MULTISPECIES: xanthine dehydrogenase family protein molybdopterin-binding subunit [unclassified Streptomyces]MDT0413646.1 xanthine dehydrogenase family protein molybdopterin-binding subunit [Streptomyces sp. DSM 41979]MDT0425724.1 xanthine dehydrogenase family protein molybdopterin-binding subunit [Streptomyces sp. DSM 41859]MYQ61415.1 molybdopterin-dependent oxidoreductase [Streptomyces sp. SID4926]SCE57898.1 xanthine dehydrogenase, molybdenum binding subunit apoprotein [Streptomyces sp. Df
MSESTLEPLENLGDEQAEERPPFGLGTSLPPAELRTKTEGTFPYAADLWAEGLLWAAVLRSPHAHARIVSIDTSEALRMRGVRAVLTHEDLPAHSFGGERPVFATEVVRHHGEAIAAVAADHPDTARMAAAAVQVTYETLDPVTDPEESFEAAPLHPDGNLVRHIPLRSGDPEAVGEIVVDGLYRIGRQDPAPIGAEAGLAVPRPDGGVELYTASTDPHGDRDLAAACYGLSPDQVKVVVTGVPGATSDREDQSFTLPLGLLAMRTQCPVKLTASREDSFLGHAHRHPTLLRYRHHADAEGRLVKVEAQILMDAGAYAGSSGEALAAAVSFACGPYVVPNAFVEGWVVRTNNPPSGHVRGEGAMQVCAAYEAQMDKLAKKLGVDPAELRLRNVLATGDVLPTGQTVTCPAPVAELLEAVRDEELPPLPKDTPEDEWLLPGGPEGAGDPAAVRRGVGYGVGMVHMLGAEGADEVATATVKIHDGMATVICAAVETGQGFSTLARQIVQDVLGIEDVRVAPVDTDQPPAGPACHGRHTWVSGGAVERAAKMVRTQLLQPLAHTFGMSAELLQIADGKITSYDGVLSTTVAETLEGKELWATAQCRPHPTEPLDADGQGDAFVGLAFCAVRAVVDVDIELGAIRVVELTVAQDVGRVLNPAQLRARIEAGVTQGVGAALTENLRTPRGLVRHPDLTGYPLPTALDTPDIRVVRLVEERDVIAPFGAKAASAVPVVTTPAAIASAVRAATGRLVNRLPIRPQQAVANP